MNILVIGSGGREHALSWKLAQSEKCDRLYVAPGNAGTQKIAKNTDVNYRNEDEFRNFLFDHQIEMVVIGPEAPLVEGLADRLKADKSLPDIMVIGPGKDGAMLEGSKDFSKAFMNRHSIPTAAYRSFTKHDMAEAEAYLMIQEAPFVIKADGLAAGKGVVICPTLDEARKELHAMLEDSKFGDAGSRVVIEAFMKGIEFSVFVLTDGSDYVILPVAKDYKRIGEGDTGLNTGGMGAVSPVPFVDDTLMKKVEDRVVKPTIAGLQSEGIDYKGFIYVGLMNIDGEPYVVEYNARMGDPETQVVMPRLKSDLVELFRQTAKGELSNARIEIDERSATTVVLASGGYPESYEKGKVIEFEGDIDNSIVFHAGTKFEGEKLITSGGRVLAVTGLGNNIHEALEHSNAMAGLIHFEHKYFRSDIGFDLA